MIRPASIADVPAIGTIINNAAEYGLMLHRSQAYLYEHVRDFFVVTDDQGGVDNRQVIGVSGLNIVWGNLAGVYALAVNPKCRGKGLGSQLVEAVIEQARQLGICRLMTLTYEQRFFERLGFSITDREDLPLKVWSQCVHCLKNNACDEIAMIRELEGVEDCTLSQAESRPLGNVAYDVPVQVPITVMTKEDQREPMTKAPVDN